MIPCCRVRLCENPHVLHFGFVEPRAQNRTDMTGKKGGTFHLVSEYRPTASFGKWSVRQYHTRNQKKNAAKQANEEGGGFSISVATCQFLYKEHIVPVTYTCRQGRRRRPPVKSIEPKVETVAEYEML